MCSNLKKERKKEKEHIIECIIIIINIMHRDNKCPFIAVTGLRQFGGRLLESEAWSVGLNFACHTQHTCMHTKEQKDGVWSCFCHFVNKRKKEVKYHRGKTLFFGRLCIAVSVECFSHQKWNLSMELLSSVAVWSSYPGCVMIVFMSKKFQIAQNPSLFLTQNDS